MTPREAIIWFVVIVTADYLAAALRDRVTKRKTPNINCDNCKRPMLLKQTKDKSFWLCRTCMRAYKREQQVQAEELKV